MTNPTQHEMNRHHAIVTKYLGPTNHKGSRIKATLMGDPPEGSRPFSVTVPFDYSLPHGYREHEPAANALLAEIAKGLWGAYGWDKAKVVGVAYLGRGEYVFSVTLSE